MGYEVLLELVRLRFMLLAAVEWLRVTHGSAGVIFNLHALVKL